MKIKQCENPLGAVYANWETCQIPTCLSHELIKSNSGYGIKSQFEYFIFHLKSGLLKQIMKSIFHWGTYIRFTWLKKKKRKSLSYACILQCSPCSFVRHRCWYRRWYICTNCKNNYRKRKNWDVLHCNGLAPVWFVSRYVQLKHCSKE